MNEPRPWFVKITGPMQFQIKPFAWQGWVAMFVWIALEMAISLLLLLESVRERWWIVAILLAAMTLALIVWSLGLAVPIEQVRAAEERERARRGARTTRR
jgi:hypothetical protein